MKEFIEKLFVALEEQAESVTNDFAEEMYKYIKIEDVKNIVNQLAEEYKDKSSIIDDLKAFLKEKFKYNSEQVEIWRDGSDNDSYFRQQKVLYMDRANIYGEVMREIDRLSEEYKVSEMPTGWIPCSERLPEGGQEVLVSSEGYVCVYAYATKGTVLPGSRECVNKDGFYDWDYEQGWTVQKEPVDAWQPLPAPYQPKGE